MVQMTEQIKLLGGPLYDPEKVPAILTLKSLPTTAELSMVGAEEFDKKVLDEILPASVVEQFDPYSLLEIDYYWILRALRLLSYGPYFGVRAIFCPQCGLNVHPTDVYQVDLRNLDVKPLPENLTKNEIRIQHSEFLNFPKDLYVHFLTIKEVLDAQNDPLFKRNEVENRGKNAYRPTNLARVCYMIHHIGDQAVTPLEVKSIINSEMSPADYQILEQELLKELTDYGLSAIGYCTCPKCGSNEARFQAEIDEQFFRISLESLRKWRDDPSRGQGEGDKNTKNTRRPEKRKVQPNS